MKQAGKTFVVIFCFVFIVFGQDGTVATSKSRSLAWVTVWNNGGFLDNLKASDIETSLDNRKLEGLNFERKSVPTTVGLIVDISGSMKSDTNNRLLRDRMAATGFRRFLETCDAGSEYFVISFGKDVNTLSDTTSDVEQTKKALSSLEATKSDEHKSLVYEALTAGFNKASERTNTKKVLILVSDGWENSDKNIPFSEVERLAKKQDALLYFIYVLAENDFAQSFNNALNPKIQSMLVKKISLQSRNFTSIMSIIEPEMNPAVFPYPLRFGEDYARLTASTGGRVFYPYGQDETTQVFEMIANELKNQYLLSYNQDIGGKKGKFKRLEVKIKNSGGNIKDPQKVLVRTRAGYYVD